MKVKNIFDVLVIGSGPSGIFTSIKLVEAGLSVALIEKGGNCFTRVNEMTGFGGAALRYDANLDYIDGIPEKSNLGNRVFGSSKMAAKCIEEVYSRLLFFGLERDNHKKTGNLNICSNKLEIIDRNILSVGKRKTTQLLKNIFNYLIDKNISFYELTEIVNITKKEVFEVSALTSERETLVFKGKRVVLATGKLSVSKSRSIFNQLGVKYKHCDSVDIGVRIETKKVFTDQITRQCSNPKINIENQGVTSRTFCWCPGGRVINYQLEGMNIIDGQHCHDNPTNQTNFGVLTTIKLPDKVDGTKFGLDYIKFFNEFTHNKTGIQIMKDFKMGNISLLKNIKKNEVTPTVSKYCLVDFNMLLMANIKSGILKLVDEINKIYPKAIMDNSLIYGPALEKNFPKVNLDFNMESSVSGFYIVGDISGKAIGIITGAAMGVKAASHIIKSVKPC